MKKLHTKSQAIPTTLVQQHCLAELGRGIEKKVSIEEQLRLQTAVINATLFGLQTVQQYMSISPRNNTVEDSHGMTS